MVTGRNAVMTPTRTIQLEHLTKSYGSHRGIVDVTLEVRAGQIVGFLGPNGAGKTTAIRVLMGFLYPTSGRASILGHDVVRDSVLVRKSSDICRVTPPSTAIARAESLWNSPFARVGSMAMVEASRLRNDFARRWTA